MADWRVARALDVLLDQLNTLAPNRNKASDGSIGDTNHQNRSSDHNPWYGPGIVTARDFTHDPGKLSGETVATTLAAHKDPRIKYVIWNRRIMSGAGGPYPWMWRAYTGSNPHTSHVHLSVVASPLCDNTSRWAGFGQQEDDMQQEDLIRRDFDGKTIKYKDLLLENWQNATDTILELRRMNEVVLRIAAQQQGLSKEALAQLIRDNSQKADMDMIRQTIREELGADNEAQADAIVDRISNRLVN